MNKNHIVLIFQVPPPVKEKKKKKKKKLKPAAKPQATEDNTQNESETVLNESETVLNESETTAEEVPAAAIEEVRMSSLLDSLQIIYSKFALVHELSSNILEPVANYNKNTKHRKKIVNESETTIADISSILVSILI